MSDDGGPFYPTNFGDVSELPAGHWRHEAGHPGASLRERFAVAIVTGGILHPQSGDMPSGWVLDQAQALTDEAMRRREHDGQNAERTNAELQAGAEAMKDEYVDGSEVERVTR